MADTRSTASPVALDRRSELIVELLRLSADPHGAAAAMEGIRGTGNALPIRPHEPRCQLAGRAARGSVCTCWLRSLDELERCLTAMKDEWRPAWYAVVHRYRLATRQPKIVTVKHGRPMLEPNQSPVSLVNRADLNKRGDGRTRLIVETWRAGLDTSWADRGVVWLADRFQGRPELPLDLLHAA